MLLVIIRTYSYELEFDARSWILFIIMDVVSLDVYNSIIEQPQLS